MKEKTRFILGLVFISAILALLIPIFIYAILAFSDPAAYNYRLSYLQDGEAVDLYLHTGEYALALVFGGILAFGMVLTLVDWLLRRKSTHIACSLLLALIAASYAIARAVYCFKASGTSTFPGILYLVSALAILGSMYFFVKKTLDGDSSWPYMACLIVGGALLFVASCTKYTYSILNAMGHQGDVVYWGSYGVSRLVLLAYLLAAFFNLNLDYEPKKKEEQ